MGVEKRILVDTIGSVCLWCALAVLLLGCESSRA